MDNNVELMQHKTEARLDKASPSEHANDACSPFCQCACCASPSLLQVDNYLIEIPVISRDTDIVHLPGKVLESDLSIWQPPQLS